MANIQTSALMGSCQKPGFSLIPDTRNTRWFWKLIGYGSGIEKYFGFGSGIGYPLVPASRDWEWRYPRPAATWWQGEEWGRWTTRQAEPGGVEEWGGSRFLFKEARKDWIFSSFQPAFNLATRTFCSVKQTLEVDSWWKWKCSSGPGWDEDSLGDIFIVPTSSLSLFCC